MKPDIVAPESATSWTTPIVAGTAGMLHAKLVTSYSLTGANVPRVIKALLLATATKDTVPDWDNSDSPHSIPFTARANSTPASPIPPSAPGRATASHLHPAPTPRLGCRSGDFDHREDLLFQDPCRSTLHPVLRGPHLAPDGQRFLAQLLPPSLRNLSLRLYQASGFTRGSRDRRQHQRGGQCGADLPSRSAARRLRPASGERVRLLHRLSRSPGTACPPSPSPPRFPPRGKSTARADSSPSRRTGDTTLPLLVPLAVTGSAISGSHFQRASRQCHHSRQVRHRPRFR